MKEWLRIAVRASVRRRALRVALVVGSILLAINHGDAILRGDLTKGRLLRMALTLLVPYLVSTFSSVGAIRELEKRPDPYEKSASPDPLSPPPHDPPRREPSRPDRHRRRRGLGRSAGD